MKKENKKLIFLTGGGTAGSVTPLLAVAQELPDYDFLWLGTEFGPEKQLVEKENIKFRAILNGKFRRYFSFKNFIDILKIIGAFFQSSWLILKFQPDLIMSAGGFVSVPVVWAGWLFSVKVLIHQQDVRAGLANKLMALFADVITVVFEKSLKDYEKAIWVGNLTKIMNYELSVSSVSSVSPSLDGPLASRGGIIKNHGKLPKVLVVGGGTGAQAINDLVYESINELTKFCQVVHLTGKGKNKDIKIDNYQQYEFLDLEKMAKELSSSDVVVSRAGMGSLTELSYFGKPTILIPMPDSHQEDNAQIFADKKAAIVLAQKDLTAKKITKEIKNLLNDEQLRNKLRNNIKGVIKTGANEKMAEIIKKLLS